MFCETLLLIRIEQKRKQMIEIACQFGLHHQETLKYSQELDQLLNLHIKYRALEKGDFIAVS
ncbi:aspartyl-phosphate phosphatase Spo0E family protein [Bacillus sp. BRMEA1]|nr:aspartyl-phosphate phosphatase Spo0E family protein [Neobacillus endophyticus]